MRHVLLFSLLFMCVPAIAGAQTENALMGIYFDEDRAIQCASQMPYQPFEVWMWCKPSSAGVQELSFRVLYSVNCAPATVTYNPNVGAVSGTPGGSVDIAFTDCQTAWVWAFHQTIYPLNTDPGMIQAVPYSAAMNPQERHDSLFVAGCNYVQSRAERVSSACINSCVTEYSPPVIEYVHFVTTTRLEAVFSEALDPASAEAAGAYRAANRADGTGEIAVTNAALQGDGVTVLLDLAEPFPDNVPYILREVGVADLLGNAWVSYGQFGNGPNLVVSAVYAPDTIADCAEIIPCSLVVTNIGSFPAGAFRVGGKLQYLDESGSWMSNEALDTYYFADCTGLLPGAAFACAFDFYAGPGWRSYGYASHAKYLRSSMRIVCTADINGSYGPVVAEASEQDNSAIAPVTLVYPIPFSDTYEAGTDVFRLEFRRSPFDDPAFPDPVTSYEVYRRSLEGTTTELAVTVPATGSQLYSCDVPRLPDREFVYLAVKANRPGPGGTKSYTSFEALMEAPFAPTAPTGLRGLGFTYGLVLIWKENPEPDMSRYRVYRGTTPDFIPNYESRLAEITWPPGHSFRDYSWYPGAGFYYKVSAVDHRKSDNESEFTLLVGDEVIATMLQAFSAELRGAAVEIAWKLAEGSDAKGFAVMRKAGESGEYETLPGLVDRESDVSFKYLDESVEPGASYRYCVAALDEGSRSILFETDAIAVPRRELTLMQNHPNPFNPTTTIEYYLPEGGPVSLTVYDVAGRRIAQLVNALQEQGSHAAQWMGRDQNGAAVASGMYFYKLDFGKRSFTRKMVFLK
jgi:hypothetical protein